MASSKPYSPKMGSVHAETDDEWHQLIDLYVDEANAYWTEQYDEMNSEWEDKHESLASEIQELKKENLLLESVVDHAAETVKDLTESLTNKDHLIHLLLEEKESLRKEKKDLKAQLLRVLRTKNQRDKHNGLQDIV